MRRNCSVTLYQDAHALDLQQMPQFYQLAQQMSHLPIEQIAPRSCWKDLYHTLMEAQHIICITGWAVYHAIKLFRGPDLNIDSRTLGEILVDKAKQGVKVYVMVWSEKTSGDFVGEDGVMGTHDMKTYNYFKPTQVNCALAPREMSVKELSDAWNNTFSSGAYTHHQKSVICDGPNPHGPSYRRRLVAYVGGLDLTGGRYDTPEFELFSTLKTLHKGDFRNSNAKMLNENVGPREPWHDIHCKVEGPVAKDVLENFIERWKHQGTKECPPPVIDNFFCQTINPEAVSVLDDPSQEWNV